MNAHTSFLFPGEKVKLFVVPTKYFMQVKAKSEALLELWEKLCPERLFLVMEKGSALNVPAQKFEQIFEQEAVYSSDTYTSFVSKRVSGRRPPNEPVLPDDAKQRALVIVWDSGIPHQYYYRENACTIFLVEEKDVDFMRKSGIPEASALTYAHFLGGMLFLTYCMLA